MLDVRKLVKPSVRGLRAYDAREIRCRIKLDANESPYPLGKDLAAIVRSVKTNRYPDPEATDLKKSVSRLFGVSSEQLLQGNGSDELIYYLIATFGGSVLFPVPTFSMYGIIARALGEGPVPVRLDRAFDIDLDKMLAAIRKEKPALVFLSSPNNPTGNCFSTERILRIIEASKGIVVVDEAYQPFSSEKGFLPFLKDYRNLVILRSLSKIGLAALRLGFLIADPVLIREVNKVRLPFNVNSFSQAVATEGLRNKAPLRAAIAAIRAERDRLFATMSGIRGVRPFPSEANFLLFAVHDPDRLYQALLRKGILVRNLNEVVPGCLRVTVGTPAENSAFLKTLKALAQDVR